MVGRKRLPAILAALALVLLLAAIVIVRGRSGAEPRPAGPASTAGPAGAEPSAAPPDAGTASGRRDGERFEDVIILEGMEETVKYEHVVNDAIGFEMDYDYELFARRGGAGFERFVSVWDEPDSPENYLELRYDPRDAATVAEAVGAVLSKEYEISREDSFPLGRAGSCIRIDASADVGGLTMPDRLQAVYIVPAADGCRVAAAHYTAEASEGFGRRFRFMMDSFAAVDARSDKRLSDEQALAAVERYCRLGDPGLEEAAKTGGYPVYWEVASSDEHEIVILFRSYTGAQLRYYIDPFSGAARVTESVPGITDGERQTDEKPNVRDYLG